MGEINNVVGRVYGCRSSCEWVHEGGAILGRREVLMGAGKRSDWKDGAIGRGVQDRRGFWRVRWSGLRVRRKGVCLRGLVFQTRARRWGRDIVIPGQVDVRRLGEGEVRHGHGRNRLGIVHGERRCTGSDDGSDDGDGETLQPSSRVQRNLARSYPRHPLGIAPHLVCMNKQTSHGCLLCNVDIPI